MGQEAEEVRWGRRVESERRMGRVSAKLARKQGAERRMGLGKLMPPREAGRRSCREVPRSVGGEERRGGSSRRLAARASRRWAWRAWAKDGEVRSWPDGYPLALYK